MTQQQITAKYLSYVQGCIAAGTMPQAFPEWNENRITEEQKIKAFSITLTSSVMNCLMTFHISATNESDAYQDAVRRLQGLEYRYNLENDSNGKVLTPEQQIQVLKRRIAADEAATERRLQAVRKRIAKLEQEEQDKQN